MFRELFHQLPVAGLVVVLATGRITHCNLAAADLFRGISEKIRGRSLLRLSALAQPDARFVKDAWRSHMEKLRLGEKYVFEWACRRLDGEAFPSRLTVLPYLLKGQVVALVSIADLSDDLRRSEQMHKRSQHLAQALQLATAGTWTSDLSADTFLLDPSLCSLLRLEGGDARGLEMPVAEYTARFFHEEDQGLVKSALEQAMTGGHGFKGALEHRFRAADGAEGWLKVAYAVEQDHASGQIKIYGVNRDITEERALLDNLRQQLGVRTELMEEIHHRVKNNLQVISSLLFLHQQHSQDSELAAGLQTIRDRIASIALVHEQLYKNHSPDRVDFVAYAVSLGERLLRSQDGVARGLKVRVEGDSFELGLREAVPCGLLLSELLSNALSHAFPDRQSGEIAVSFMIDPQGRRRVIVSDDGVGLGSDKDTGSASFLPATAKLTLGSREAGWKRSAAVGLRLASRLADQLMGELVHEERSGGGTIWRLELPPP